LPNHLSTIHKIQAQGRPPEWPHLLSFNAQHLRHAVLQDRDPIFETMVELDNRQRIALA
jgi:hypothetical protein